MLPPEDNDFLVRVKKISLDEAREAVKHGFISAIGHQSTAQVLTELLGVEVKENRIQVVLKKGVKVIVFQLHSRLPEGKVLSEEELKALKYSFFEVTLAI